MRFRKGFFPVFLWILFFVLLPSTGLADDQEMGDKNVSFRWAFGAMVGSETDRRLVAITRDTTLKTGDQIKMLVELRKSCYVYLFYRTDDDQLVLLFPFEFSQFDTDYHTGKKYYIPQGNRWFELDQQVGLETFYLLASAERLTDLEALFNRYERADPAGKRSLSAEVLAEIRKIRKKNRKFETSAERPVPIGGNVRGVRNEGVMTTPDIDPIADVVSAHQFYSRTFTIDHR
jgi:hypothetical protein